MDEIARMKAEIHSLQQREIRAINMVKKERARIERLEIDLAHAQREVRVLKARNEDESDGA